MAKKKAKYQQVGNFKIDVENKLIVADFDNFTELDTRLIAMYINSGYIVKAKQKGLTYDAMFKALKGKEELKKQLQEKIDNKENYMKIRTWFKNLEI